MKCHCGQDFDTEQELWDHFTEVEDKPQLPDVAGKLCKFCDTEPAGLGPITIRTPGMKAYTVMHDDMCAGCLREYQEAIDGRVRATGGKTL